jgi:plastocyanin
MKHNRLVLGSAAVLVLMGSLGLTGCSGTGKAATVPGEPVATVTVTNMSYSEAEVEVQVGDTVEWVFDDGDIPHDVAGEGELKGDLQSELMTQGTYTYTFEEPGTYTYHCTPHPWMVGKVVVEG